MEKDDEVKGEGNSYDFGARIYDPRIGRWLSRDPLESKYPMHSPYNAMNNSPTIYIDTDGREWIIATKSYNSKTGTLTIKITIDIAVLNSSTNAANQLLNMTALASEIEKQLESSYNLEYDETLFSGGGGGSAIIERKVKVELDATVRSISSVKQLNKGEHLVEVKDDSSVKGIYGKANSIGGSKVTLNANAVPDIISGNDKNTVPHEIGHTGGLFHPNVAEGFFLGIQKYFEGQLFSPVGKKDVNNAMYSGGSGLLNDKTSTEINKNQAKVLINNIEGGDVNKGVK